ncbi:hypothetical protein KP509_17G069800 [Ceratopteris richardii]|uniref:Peroxidase n=1 Tax=Ceratopteris richardii TaxID=49495 RepID=A0A8T2SZA0_CERRI|nr:hypothetical protein KP509_17G069800 [Ceratopteris richardii]
MDRKSRLHALVLLCLMLISQTAAVLRYDYYDNTCPDVENIVRSALIPVFLDVRAPAAMIRLLFHDCQVDGCEASILLNKGTDGTRETDSPSNLGIRKLSAIDKVKVQLEAVCPQTVSCADIIALAARDAVARSGGPDIRMPLGRLDGFEASSAAATQALPPATISASGAVRLFEAMGMNLDESVAMLGSHTVGAAHCTNFVDRLYPQLDPDLGPVFGASLRARCPNRSDPAINLLGFLDTTFLRFDNSYFKNVLNHRGLLSVDSALAYDPTTRPVVEAFANDEGAFFRAYASGLVKLSSYRVLSGSQGEVRVNCGVSNR